MIIRRRSIFGDAIDDEIRANLRTGMFDAEINANIAAGMNAVGAVEAATGRPALAGEWNLTPAQISGYYGPSAGDAQPSPFVPEQPQPAFVPLTQPPAFVPPTPATQMVSNGVVADLMAAYAHANATGNPADTGTPFPTVQVAVGLGALGLAYLLFGRH